MAHATTAGLVDLQISSDTTLVSSSMVKATGSVEGLKLARRQLQVHAVGRAEVQANDAREVSRTRFVSDRIAQDQPCFLFNGSAVFGGACK